MMGPGGGMGMGPGGNIWRNLRADKSVVETPLSRGTFTRILRFARPHRALIAVFLLLTVVDSMIVVVNPHLTKRLIDHGILGNQMSVVVTVSATMAAVAVLDAVILGISLRWMSARI